MKSLKLWQISLIALLTTINTALAAELPVIPGAAGFGITTPAGRGGTVYKITNLEASGQGSLQDCINKTGPRVCVFEVSGTIEASNRMDIYSPFLTIAGQTAPSPGITIKGAGLNIDTHDVLIQHIRVRIGDSPNGPDPDNRDGISIEDYNSGASYNIVIDHVSVSWAIDENIAVWGDNGGVNNVTITNSITSEALFDSLHSDGVHSMGLLVGRRNNRIALINNLFIHNNERNPLIRDSIDNVVAVNNLVYNPGGNWPGTRIDFGIGGSSDTLRASVVGNKVIMGPSSGSKYEHSIRIDSNVPINTSIYVEDNEGPGRTSDPWSVVNNNAGPEVKASTKPIWISGFNPLSSAQVEDYVLANAGARPADRDSVDKRIVNDVKNGTGRIIDSQSDVGGWPNLAQNIRPLTLPANPNDDDDGDGYTNLEEWLHAFAADVEPPNENLSPPATPFTPTLEVQR